MANTIKLKRASGSDPSSSDLSTGELAIRTSNCKLFSKNDSGSAIGIVAGSADTLTTARTIAGVSFDGSANISLNNNAITNGAGYITATLTQEQVEDYVGGMVTGNTETGITVTYDDSDGTLDFVVASQTENDFTTTLKNKLDGIAASAIANVVEDTSPQLGGNLDVQSNKITTATSNGNVKIEPNGSGVVEVRGAGGNDGALMLNCSAQSHGIKLVSPAHSAGQSYTFIFPDNQIAADKYLKVKSISGSGSTASGQLEYASLDANDLGEGTVPDARFPSTLPALNGSALTNLNADNISSGTISASRIPTLNQNTTGSAATLTTARTIAGVSFDGSANISLNNNAITNGAGYITSADGGNAATLDGIDSSQFARSDADDTLSGSITLSKNASDVINFSASSTNDNRGIAFNGRTALSADNSDGYLRLNNSSEFSNGVYTPLVSRADGGFNTDGNTVINDSGNYVRALSGASDYSSLLRANADDTATGVLTLNAGLSFGADAKCAAGISTLSDGSTITVDFTSGIHHTVTLGGNRTFGNPSNDASAVGQSGSIFIVQDGTGSRTASFHSDYKFVGGTAPTLSTAANAVDRLDYVVRSSGNVHCVLSLDVK